MYRVLSVVVLVLALVAGQFAASICFAAGHDKETRTLSYPLPPRIELDTPITFVEEVGIQYISVSVNEPCDEEWRAHYPSTWAYEANVCIEAADDKMAEVFDIDLYSGAQRQWDSDDSTTDIGDLLDEAISEWGLGGKQLMIAFTGQDFGDVVGRTPYAGSDYCLIAHWTKTEDCHTTREEASHMYGASHSTCDGGECILVDAATYYNNWCTTCHDTIYANRDSK